MTGIDIMAQAMNIDTGAPARAEEMWLQTDWRHIEADVKRLQMRIAKATLEGRWGKVKARQYARRRVIVLHHVALPPTRELDRD